VNPSNILLDNNGLPVITDFDSCYKIGESLKGGKAGTFGWDHDSNESQPENDFVGLKKM
jgi:serine/threonine protein kinase